MYSKVVLVGILLFSLFVANMLAFLSKGVAKRRRDAKAEELRNEKGNDVAITLITGFWDLERRHC